MVTRVLKWGNSHGVRLTKQVLREARLSAGDAVEVTVRDGAIVVVPARRIRGRCSIRELVARMPKHYEAEEVDWGRPVGRETW